ncbi:hypothetical protein LK07_00915 [Streptomyces pluripotens]|uniref:Pyridoxamine 5'-phosphate oxidase family protein n=1 Tax=Streptomyces pluripotens TaxID=1355015 RepID=A0A221NS48_9ACTN|nr:MULTISPECIES: pyridoxamine 5'-phosphate oxidase family protein [Streptomyces]ASN22823.1 hypothetical protein LK07_00915 [Streptomyces pluripotens]KIE23348.1 hypothetical protein LK08_30575 [Streptomyces sp. MUSC 125]MCH0558217.1 pyridoxamine 5'-phosphate oxidase family protein [Streptomyces sp. MUM 16J]
MTPLPTALRMTEVSGAEAVWLLEGSSLGRLAYVRRQQADVRPARHVWEYGHLVVRASVPAAAVSAGATYQVDEVCVASGTGWTVTAAGPVDVIADPDEAAHYHRTLPGLVHGPHDTLIRIRPQSVTGFRITRDGESR